MGRVAKKRGLKTIVHSHSTSNGSGFASLVKKVMQFPLRHQADYLFACSKEAGEWLFGKKAVKKDNFKVIYNGIDCERFHFNEQDRVLIREKYGIKDNFVVGNIGRHIQMRRYYSGLILCQFCRRSFQEKPR